MYRYFFLISAALFGFAATAGAQSGVGKALVFTGTTATSGADTYAWLAWHPTDPGILENRVLAVYIKTGNAASPAAFSRISVVAPAGDIRLISSLLPLSQKVGQDLPGLGTMLDDLLGDATAAASVTIPEKIFALLAGSLGDDEQTRRLYTLALQHPAIALAAGVAHADKIAATGALTYELREYDPTADRDLGVIGRVTLDPAAPFVLPAPGAPVEVPDLSPKGNLNASLRWATPNTLRDLAPLHHGYNLYRVLKSVAEPLGWHTTPPTAAALAAEGQAKRVNVFPILPQRMLTQAEAANAADTETIFVTDDKGRYQPGGTPFNDGARFYYFVAARDVLGRSGQPSAGTLVRMFDRLPPNPPRNTRVRSVATYNGTVHDQRFVVEWDSPVLPIGETISEWYVYRWRTPDEIPMKSRQLDPVVGKPERNLIAILPVGTRIYTDNGSTAPPAWAIVDEPAPDIADKGKTYYYTVRAADGSVAKNLSGNSAPAWGVLRDRIGPLPTSGDVIVSSFAATPTFVSLTQMPFAGLPSDQSHYLFTCESTLARGLDWAEFRYLTEGGPAVPLGHVRFAKNAAGNLVAALRKTIPDYAGYRPFQCRVGTNSGYVSLWVSGPEEQSAPQDGKFILEKWNVALTPSGGEGSTNGWRHETTNPVTGATTDVSGSFTAPADAKEFRIYRRVNDGSQTLVAQGETGNPPTVWQDTAQLASCATVEYFLQTLDANSNAGPLVRQGEPLTFIAGLPIPMLEPPTSLLPLTNPKMRVKWFCSTAGVERFEIWVARKSGKLPSNTNSGLSEDLAGHPNVDTSLSETAGLDFAVFQTGPARYLSAGGTPEFEAILPVSLSDTYTVMVRAVGAGEYSARAVGAFSNVGTSAYSILIAGANLPVPWPDRPLPPRGDFHPGIVADTRYPTTDIPLDGNMVRIGEYSAPEYSPTGSVSIYDPDDNNVGPIAFYAPGTRNPIYYLYTNEGIASAEPLEANPGCILPVALYRVQIANNDFPLVSGDLVQVSPLMEKIAYIQYRPDEIAVIDPFMAFLHKDITGLPRSFVLSDHDIFLRDSQPVIKGAKYKYLLVRFSPTREIERVIVTNAVTVPVRPPETVIVIPPEH